MLGTISDTGFGQTIVTTGSSTDPYEFAATSGYRNDGDGWLMRVGARYYDAQVGRFITRDTDLSQKPYLYCNGDPINYVDPSGHQYSNWNPFTWDYNFTNDDWIDIENNIDEWGNKEIYWGTGGAVGGAIGWGAPSPGQNIPGLTPPSFGQTSPGWYEPTIPEPAKPGGVVGAIGGGLIVGGMIAKGIAWVMHLFD